ncbi:MAG: translation initiation factor IF-2 N-terminal domain-containing protein, partial [Proteobacteria bacterium]|nr:translation initiation factor IF-2 N-terminal domain-containing protein [Pseudomonadota bacterium]
RSSPIVVEKKKRRLIKPAGGAAPTGGSATSSPMQSTDKDVQRRMKALEEAKRLESARQSTDQQEASLREEEREERRRQRIEKDKVEQDIHNKKRGLTQKTAKPEVKKEPPKDTDKNLGKEADKDSPKPIRDTAPQDLPQSIPQDIPQDMPQDMGDKPKSRGPSARGKNLEPQNEDKKTHRPNARSGDNERRRAGKLTISQALQDNDGHQRSLASIKRKQERQRRELRGEAAPREKIIRDVQLPPTITVQELANRMAEKTNSVVKALMTNGIMATQNETIDADTAELIVAEFGHNITRVSDADVEDAIEQTPDLPADLRPRAPVVTIMGHVDHGKTSVLDALRKTSVVTGEAGGITQHIGAYQITAKTGAEITFLDTPGHAAFTSMRARGAQVTDIVILVVAANDSVKPQTIEAISHALAAKVPVIVAINKTDLPDADINKVRTDLLQHNIVVESMSGDVQDVEISAKTGAGLDNLVDAISLQ